MVAKADGHAVSAGMINLMDLDGKTAVRTALVEQDGTFRLNYIPEGQYVLHVNGASDIDPASAPSGAADPMVTINGLLNFKKLKSYADADLPITVKGDSTGLSIQVPDATSTPQVPGMGGVLGGTQEKP